MFKVQIYYTVAGQGLGGCGKLLALCGKSLLASYSDYGRCTSRLV